MGKSYLEKSLKRFLKRKVRITLGFIVAFLLSCNFVSADTLEITENDGNILFNGQVFDEETHEYTGNTFENGVYTNNVIMQDIKNNENSYSVFIYNFNDDIKFVNNNYIYSFSSIDNEDNIIQIIGIAVTTENGNISLLNEGNILVETDKIFLDYDSWTYSETIGAAIYGTENNNINFENNGIIETYGGYQGEAIYLMGKINEIKNNGILSSINDIDANGGDNENYGINTYQEENVNVYTNIDKIINNGIINTKGYYSRGIQLNNAKVENTTTNNGGIFSFGESSFGINLQIGNIEKIENNGIIAAIGEDPRAIRVMQDTYEMIENKGLLYAAGNSRDNTSFVLGGAKNTKNIGTIIYNNSEKDGQASGIEIRESTSLNNYGIISASNPVYIPSDQQIDKVKNKIKNLGLYLSAGGKILEVEYKTGEEPIYSVAALQEEKTISVGGDNDSGKIIINAGSDADGFAQSIKSETIKNLNSDEGYILNSYHKTVVIDNSTGDKEINNSVINAVQTAVYLADGKELSLNSSTVNGGYGYDIIKGDESSNILNISDESVINGNINLGNGDDKLSVTDTVQLNGNLNGGEGDDTLTFSKNSESDSSINILYDILGFETTSIGTNVTLYEKTIDEDGNIKGLTAELGEITIENNGKLTLRVDGTDTVNDKIIGHALYENKGSLKTEETGKLNLGLYGVGTKAVIDFGSTDISELNSENIETSSILHNLKVNETENTIEVSAKKDLTDIEVSNYDKLNKIYHSLLTSDEENFKSFTVEEEQYSSFLKYLHDIYAGNPYAFSSELSRKTLGIMRNLADKDLKPELNKWAVYGGFTHVDGGTENSYYGKGYYTYDIGSRDIEADTKITGGYAKAEFGKSETLTTGIIFGGNNSETEIGASKVEGDSFYFGAYAKKYINDFRFTLGAGFEHGDYKADRIALGYSGITETRKYSENYHDRGFDIYGNAKYSKEIGNNFYFEPSMTLSYTYIDQDGAKEDGVLAIETGSKYFDYSSAEVNLDLRKAFGIHSFTAGVSYERMLSGYDEEFITGRMIGGSDFDILVPEKEKDIFSLNAKYELETERGFIFDVKGSYRFEHGDNNTEWTVGTGIGYKF